MESSSAGSGAPGSEPAGPKKNDICIEKVSKVIATQMPYTGILFVDQVADNSCYVTNTVTQERVKLPDGVWDMFFGDNDLGAALVKFGGADGADADMGNPMVVDVEEFLRKTLFVCDRAERWVDLRGGCGRYSLDHAMTKYYMADARIRVGVTSARGRLGAVVMTTPRGGAQRVFWNMTELYDLLQLKSYKGQPSKWIGRTLERWQVSLEGQFGGIHMFIRAKHAGVGERVAQLPFFVPSIPRCEHVRAHCFAL